MTTEEELDKIAKEVLGEIHSLHKIYPKMSPAAFIKLCLVSVSISPPAPEPGIEVDGSTVILTFLPTGDIVGAFVGHAT